MDWKEWMIKFEAVKNEHNCLKHLDSRCHCRICGAICHQKIENDSKGYGTGMVTAKCAHCTSYAHYYDDTGSEIENTFEKADLQLQQAAVSKANLAAAAAWALVSEAEAESKKATARADSAVAKEYESPSSYAAHPSYFEAETEARENVRLATALAREREELAYHLKNEVWRIEHE